MGIEYFISTDIGKERKKNEDSIASFVLNTEVDGESKEIGFFIVSDGMGGHNAGEIASLTAVKEIVSYVNRNYYGKVFEKKFFKLPDRVYNYHFVKKRDGELRVDSAKILERAIKRANEKIIDLSRQNPAFFGMGATVVCAMVEGYFVTVANVGDSRFYLIDEEKINLISTDHTIVNQMIKMGSITLDEAKNHPGKNFLYKSLGAEEFVQPDIFQLEVMRGNILLLCSDGLTNMVGEEEIFQMVRESRSLRSAVKKLIRKANINGGKDNISVILIKIF